MFVLKYYICNNFIVLKMSEVKEGNLWNHKWGIPIAHTLLWIIGMFVTTDVLGVLKQCFPADSVFLAVSLGTVIVIFFGEIIFTFLDVVLEQKIKIINITFFYYLALLIAVVVVTVVLMFLGCYYYAADESKILGQCLIGMLIIVSAFAKGMEIWLQNNWDKYMIDVPSRVPQLSYTTT